MGYMAIYRHDSCHLDSCLDAGFDSCCVNRAYDQLTLGRSMNSGMYMYVCRFVPILQAI